MAARQTPSLSGRIVEDEPTSYGPDDWLQLDTGPLSDKKPSLPVDANAGLNPGNSDEKQLMFPGEAKRGLTILNEIINLLPVGITLETAEGDILFANDTAVQFAQGVQDIDRALLLNPGKSKAVEIEAACTSEIWQSGETGERTLLTTRKPIRVNDQVLFLSSSFDITGRKQFEEELSRRVYLDELTGLPNRCWIQAQVQHTAAEAKNRFALAFLDIDNFKHINDYYGPAAGDQLLTQAAKRISANIRRTDMLARISGDEFLLLVDPIDTGQQLSAFIERLLGALKKPFFIDGFEICVSASVGVSLYPEHGTDYETLRRNADTAMYHVKNNAKGNVTIFDCELGSAVAARAELEQRLRLAVRDRRFRCAFQPKVDILTQEVVGVEALVRLIDEEGIIKAPGSFIQLAVELGLIDDLTHMVLNEVMNSIDHLNEAFGPNITISINVAAKQAGDMGFMGAFIQSLKNTNCSGRFMVEVTEDAFVAKTHFETQVLPMLRAIGVKVSIDDFGTGYSSLSALIGITADEIKIDRSFITDIQNRPRSQSVLKAIESLGDALGMTIIAEGVETIEELNYLQTNTRIRYAQGYYFSKPLFFDELTRHKSATVVNLRRPVNRGPIGKPRSPSRFR